MSVLDIITFPYGAISPPYSSARPHRGNDYAAAHGEPLRVAGTIIGAVGETGLTIGPHVHVQAGPDEWAQSPVDPLPFTNQPGVVVKTGEASQWGKYVCIRVGHINVFYCHMSRIDVHNGQVIGEEIMTQDAIEKLVSQAYRAATDIDPTPDQAGYWVERIRSNPNTAYELLAALGGGSYQGDPRFREKARNYDRDVAEAGGGFVESKVFVKKG